MDSVLLGAVAMVSSVAAMFFFRFWRRTRDRFFLLFALAFRVDTVNRASLGLMTPLFEGREPIFYWVRLGTFVLILVAIVDKNLRARRGLG